MQTLFIQQPVDKFTIVDNPDAFDVTQVADDADYAYILEIEGHIPKDKHDM